MKEILTLNHVTGLSQEQCEIILGAAQNLQIMADLSQADLFINCLLIKDNASLVVAEAKPTTTASLYKKKYVRPYSIGRNGTWCSI